MFNDLDTKNVSQKSGFVHRYMTGDALAGRDCPGAVTTPSHLVLGPGLKSSGVSNMQEEPSLPWNHQTCVDHMEVKDEVTLGKVT